MGRRPLTRMGWGQNNLAAAVSSHLSLFSPGQVPIPRPLAVGSRISLKAANIEGGRYVYLQDLRELDRQSMHSAPISWPTCPTPLRLENWVEFLSSHPDQEFASCIHMGLSLGFRIGCSRRKSELLSASRNHPSASANPIVVSDYIQTEREEGRLVGPLDNALCPLVQVSPIGLVPKSHQSGRWRMIVDLSYPPSRSVNDGIAKEPSSMSYASVDDAVECIQRLGPGTELIKVDLKNAYRIIPVHPQDHHLLAIRWEDRTYIDRALPFGLRSAPKIFSGVADMLAWALHWAGIQHQIHYLDDFLFMVAPGTDNGAHVLALARRVLQHLGVPVAVHKTEGPSTVVSFLGILIDTISFELRLPTEKVMRLQSLIRGWIQKQACTRKELECLLGHLAHAASVVRPGRTFLRQLFGLLHLEKASNHYIRLSRGARADLSWWKCFLQVWNGSSFFPPPHPSYEVYSDASGSFGCGAFTRELGWFQVEWPESWMETDIATKELVPVVVAAAIWGRHWSGKHVRFHSDNTAVVATISSRTAKTPLLMHLLRCFSFYCAYFRFHFSAEHIPGPMNVAADAISRNNLPSFLSLIPQVPRCNPPSVLLELLVVTRPDWGSPTWTQLFVRSLLEVSQDQP